MQLFQRRQPTQHRQRQRLYQQRLCRQHLHQQHNLLLQPLRLLQQRRRSSKERCSVWPRLPRVLRLLRRLERPLEGRPAEYPPLRDFQPLPLRQP